MKNQMRIKITALLLSIALLAMQLPAMVFANEEDAATLGGEILDAVLLAEQCAIAPDQQLMAKFTVALPPDSAVMSIDLPKGLEAEETAAGAVLLTMTTGTIFGQMSGTKLTEQTAA